MYYGQKCETKLSQSNEVLPSTFLKWVGKITTSIRISGLRAEIWGRNVLNTDQNS